MNDTIQKQYYTVTQVGEMLGFSNSKIRYWSDFLGIRTKRSYNNARRFTLDQIKIMEFVKKQTEDEGRTLAKARIMVIRGLHLNNGHK